MIGGMGGPQGLPQAGGGLATNGGPGGSQLPFAPLGGPAPLGQSGLAGNGLGAGGNPNHTGPTQEDVFGLLEDNLLRRFKIDIEVDSTIAGDEGQEKQDRTQFIESMTKFMEAWGPMVMQKPEIAPLAGQLLMFGVRAFRVGRELEEVIEETADKMTQPGAMQGGAGDSKVAAEKIKLQATQVKTQAEVQKAQVDSQTGQQEAAAKMQAIVAKAQMDIEKLKMEIAAKQQEHIHAQGEAQMAHGAAMDQMALEGQKARTAQQAAQMPKWPVDPGKTQGF